MIRILCVDDHEAVRAGLHGLIRTEPGLVPVGVAADESELWPALTRTRPDIVLMDYQLPASNGLLLCHRIKSQVLPPRVVIYSAYADDALAVPAHLARADAILGKTATADELFETVREVCRGGLALPGLTPRRLEIAGQRLDPEDLSVLSMTLDQTPPDDMAEVIGVDVAGVRERVERLIGKLTGRAPDGA